MLLAIEQGNTNTLFAVHDGTTWVAQWRTATQSTRTADEYAVWPRWLTAVCADGFNVPRRTTAQVTRHRAVSAQCT